MRKSSKIQQKLYKKLLNRESKPKEDVNIEKSIWKNNKNSR